MFKQLITVISLLFLFQSSQAGYYIPCSNKNINYREIFTLIKSGAKKEHYEILLSLMAKCSKHGRARINHLSRNNPNCRSMSGYYSYASHSINICTESNYERESLLMILIHEAVHSLKVNIDMSQFIKIWIKRDKERTLSSLSLIPRHQRTRHAAKDELLAYNLERYATHIYNGEYHQLNQYTENEKVLFEYILNGNYH